MPYKTIDKGHGEAKVVLVRGRVLVKESGLPITNVVTQLYWVNLEAFQQEKKAWHKCLEKAELVTKASATEPNRGGSFSVELNAQDALGKQAVLGLIVWPPDIAEVKNAKPVFILETPRVLGANEAFIVEVSEKNLVQGSGGPTVVTNLPNTKIFDKAEENLKVISDWHKNYKIKDFEKTKVIRQKAKEAFKNFNPSSVPRTLQDSDNYFKRTLNVNIKDIAKAREEDKKQLKEQLQRVRNKALQNTRAKNVTKTRQIKLSPKMVEKYKLEEGKEIKLKGDEVKEILEDSELTWDDSLDSALEKVQQQKAKEKKAIDTLFSYLDFKLDE